MNDRKLASIQVIQNIEPIKFEENGIEVEASAIERATIQGWSLVVKKGDFKPGDMCVYFEIDSLVPDEPVFNFLSDIPSQYPYRIKTKKFKGTISQGLALPIYSFDKLKTYILEEELDVTDVLNIGKYEPVDFGKIGGEIKGSFPSHLDKTDEKRLQSCVKVLNEMHGEKVYVTTKLDGTSFTSYYDHIREELVVCSRNNKMRDGDNVYWKMAHKYDLENCLKEQEICIQGEICGPGIQKNRLGLKEQKLFLFNTQNIIEKRHSTYAEFKGYTSYVFSHIPSVFDFEWYECNFDKSLQEWLELAKGKYPGTTNNREGIVIRSTTGKWSKVLEDRFSVKVINNDYLLKEDQ
jgi:RNA ligase (TIGR02306 family)